MRSKADRITITDNRFPERSGYYFADSLDGEYGDNGIRQTIKIKHGVPMTNRKWGVRLW